MAQARLRESDTVSAFECDVIREAFRKWVVEDHVPEHEWREGATLLIRLMTGHEHVDPAMVDWIIGK